jgi:hypothetical protein
MVDGGPMSLAAGGVPATFSDRVLRLLERVEHRVALTPADREAAFRLRFEAYQKIGFLQRHDVDWLYDPRYDDAPNAWVTTTFIDGELAGTVRVNIGADENAILPGLQVFADVLVPRLSAGEVIAEFTRLAARLSLSSIYPELAYVVMRPAFMAAEHFEADCAVGTPRAEHIAVYRRAFGATVWRPPRLSRIDRQARMCGRRFSPRATNDRDPLSLFPVRSGGKRGVVRAEQACVPPLRAVRGLRRGARKFRLTTFYAAERGLRREESLACSAYASSAASVAGILRAPHQFRNSSRATVSRQASAPPSERPMKRP